MTKRKADDCGGRTFIATIPVQLNLYKTRDKSYLLELSEPWGFHADSPWFGIAVPLGEWRIPEDGIIDYCENMNWFEIARELKKARKED